MAPDYLQPVLDPATEQFFAENKVRVTVTYEPYDSLLSRAAEHAGFDVIFASAREELESLGKDSLINDTLVLCPFRLSLALFCRVGGPLTSELDSLKEDIFRRVVLFDPSRTFEGELALEILRKKRLWKDIQDKVAIVSSRAQMVSFLHSGEADAALTLESSLMNEKGVVATIRFDDKFREPLAHCAAVSAGSKVPATAMAFIHLFDSPLCAAYQTRGVFRIEDKR